MNNKKFVGSFDLSLIPNLQEFDKRYRHTFMLVTIPGKEEDVYWYEGHEDDVCYFSHDVYKKIELKQDSEAKVRSFFPPIGLFNSSDLNRVGCVYRIPSRMNYRSCCSKNTKMLQPIQTLSHRMSRPTISFSFKEVRDSLTGNLVSDISTARLLANNECKKGVAISRDYMLSLGIKETDNLLWYKELPIGFLEDTNFRVDEHYFQEFSDFLRTSKNNNFTVEAIQ